jgi:nucleotide-binding universal stress UspA family protein
MLFKRVLIPIDLSEVSAEQLECALQLKRYGMEELVLLNVLTLEGGILPEDELALNNLLKKAMSAGVKARTVVEKGKVSNKILEVAKRERSSLIVMASSGKTKATELMVGSVSLEVVRRTKVPVLVGKFFAIGKKKSSTDCVRLLESVLVSVDLTSATKSVLETFKQLDQSGCERAVLFHVVPSNKYSVEDNDKFQSVKKDLSEWKEAHKGNCELDTHLHYGSPAYNIIEAAREFDATLILMGNVGKGLLHSMTLGSVSDEVLRKSNVHVMIVPC